MRQPEFNKEIKLFLSTNILLHRTFAASQFKSVLQRVRDNFRDVFQRIALCMTSDF